MRYLAKRPSSQIPASGWTYPRDAARIRRALLDEQQGFCAYSEGYVRPTDACDVEHFDPRLKGKPEDGYRNWYAVRHWMNAHKPPKIESFEPVLDPADVASSRRVGYSDGQYQPADPADSAARNLIAFLGWNRPELAQERSRHVNLVRDILERLAGSPAEALEYLRTHPELCSFATVLEAELGISLDWLGTGRD
jgi:hypothetical protein